jgi:hypothetical protein
MELAGNCDAWIWREIRFLEQFKIPSDGSPAKHYLPPSSIHPTPNLPLPAAAKQLKSRSHCTKSVEMAVTVAGVTTKVLRGNET